ncbi:MAG: hypothetical protein AEth_00259 [Candidatus Argoarchaeum ethanivorans]|uniref:Uncharacterized protein n=1 Tax=Candidatus Argoarchaeum ethanivorans TaxID=2608793 RepID=A0A8B3S404_9EURY|nr:MAG: hypothetical protein AEth_00259 [Candidatus Argoarchaeum ethanivorans]
MSGKFYNTITEILTKQEFSISGVSRELKKHGYDYHRLIVTGYLRALEDVGYMERKDVPPSRIYACVNKEKDIYELIADKLDQISIEKRLHVAVFLLTNLLGRPCFKHELTLLGISNPNPNPHINKSMNENLDHFRADVTRINIPPNDLAYELIDNVVPFEAVDILLQILKDRLDLGGLKAKHQQTTLVKIS